MTRFYTAALWVIGAALAAVACDSCGAAYAIKRDPEADLERVKTELRLRTAELAVTRGQLRACERRAAE